MTDIRAATFADIPLLIRLKPGVCPPDYFESCFDPELRRDLLIVSHDGEECGFCILNWLPKYPLYRRLSIPEIQDLNVLPERRRLGLATALIRHCESVVKQAGHDMIGIGVGLTADYGPAQRLYIKLGYIPDGYGVTCDRVTVRNGELRPIDDDMSLMLVKEF